MSNAARLAAEFYQAVTGTTDSDPSKGSAILIGYSMGTCRICCCVILMARFPLQ